MSQSVIRFSGRRPIPERVTIGMEGEHNAEELVLVNLPEIAEGQTETIELVNWNGSAADALLLTDHKVLLTRTTMSMTGTLTAWAVVQNGTSVVWKSEKFFLEVKDLPDADEMIEQQYPTAFEEAMGITGADVASANNYRKDAEAWARGTRGGTAVGSTDSTYHNNAKYYADQAGTSAANAGDSETAAGNSATAAANSQTAAGLSADAAAYSAGEAADSEENAEAWANGTRNGTDVSSDDPVYHKNGAYYRGQALAAMNNAQTYKRQAEAYAKGTRDGTDVPSGGVGYHDNAKWYAEQAGDSEENAEAWANGTRGGVDVTSGDPAYNKNGQYYRQQAAGAMNNAQTFKQQAEAYAKGTMDGTPVPSGGVGYQDNAKYYAEQAADAAEAAVAAITADAVGLPAGSSPTAVLSDGVLTIGVPKGDKGDTGSTGATPTLSIGSVSTLPAGQNATATITGTAEAPVLNLGIPKGGQGDTGADGYSPTASVSKTGARATITITDKNGTTTAEVSDGSGVPVGGATGQVLKKHSNTDGDVEWGSVDALPSGGTAGQVLKKNSGNNAAEWGGYAVPAGGYQGQALKKFANADGSSRWEWIKEVPTTDGHVSGEQLEVNAGGVGGTYQWYKRYHVPTGGSSGQVLTKSSATNGDVGWSSITGVPTGGSTGQVLTKNSGTNGDVKWATVSGGASSLGQLSDVDTNGATGMGYEALIYNGSYWEPGAPTYFTYIDDWGDGTPYMPNLDDVYAAYTSGYRIMVQDYFSGNNEIYVVTNVEAHDDGGGNIGHVCEITRIKDNGKIVKRVFSVRYVYDSGEDAYVTTFAEETPSGMVSNIEMITQAMYDAKAQAGTLDAQTLYCIKEN